MNNKKNIIRKAIMLLLVFAMLLPISGPAVVMPSAAVTQAEIDALKSSAGSLAGEKKELQKELKAIQADKSKAQEQKNLFERQINVIQSEINNINDQITKYGEMITQKEAELVETQQKEQEQYELFCQRIRAMEEEGETSYWAILFNSSDFSELLDNFIMVEEIIEYDNGIMDNLIAIHEQLDRDKAELEAAKSGQEAAKQEQEVAKQELKSQQNEVDKLIKEISSKEEDAQAAIKKMESAAAAMDAEIKKKEKALAAQIANVVSESGFLWPLNASYNTLSSLYGSRTHPVTGKPNKHTGIDLPAPSGTKIYAAKSGVVVTSTYHSSYGNYVVVSHSDGTSTLYAHMSKRNATEGSTVKQGDVVGYVGTTGSSTGNHLHFEIRVNGNRTDPLHYFKDKTLYATAKGQTKLLQSGK